MTKFTATHHESDRRTERRTTDITRQHRLHYMHSVARTNKKPSCR